jgi:hypothetical protein
MPASSTADDFGTLLANLLGKRMWKMRMSNTAKALLFRPLSVAR